MVLRFLLRVAVFGVFLALGLELLFRVGIPASEKPAGRQDPQWGIMTADPQGPRDGRHSIGRLGRPAFHWRINRQGFISSQDYVGPAERDLPCVAVIGNSYFEGLYSDVDENLAARLQARWRESAVVYNLAASGMPLSQVPPVAAYAAAEFSPGLIILQGGSGSLTRSLRNNGRVPYCQQYRWDDGELSVTPPSPLRVRPLNRLLRRSALVRYLYFNANVDLGGGGDVVQAALEPDAGPAGTLEGIPFEVYDRVLDRVFADIRAVSDAPILLIIDGDRRTLYARNERPERDPASSLIEAACRRNGVHFLDLTDAFWEDFRQHGRKFNFEENYHWNPYGVQVVAAAIAHELESAGLIRAGRLALGSPPEAPHGSP